MASIPPAVRRESLARLVAQRGLVRVVDAALELGVTEVTVRSDLDALVAEGRVVRVHGAAMPAAAVVRHEDSVDATRSIQARAKAAIGEAAARIVRSGHTVYLDSGSTTDAVASALVDRHELEGVLVVTNSLTVALTLEPAIPRIEVIVTGGSLRPLQHSLVNPFAAPMIESLHVDVAFIGCTGVDAARGVSNVNVAEAEIKALLLARATESVLVADSTKIGRVDRAHVGTIDSFASIVTAGVIDGPRLAELRGTGVAIVRADA